MYEVFISGTVLKFIQSRELAAIKAGGLALEHILRDPHGFVKENLSLRKSILIPMVDPEQGFGLFASCFHVIKAAGCLVESAGGRYLMIYRRGFWDLPKGKVDQGESDQEAALRETREECGISFLRLLAPMPTTFHMYLLKDEVILKRSAWYHACVEGEPALLPQQEEDITRAVWLESGEVKELFPLSYPAIAGLLNRWI
jgi:8-oxo-dGTP pyrophosphatase MutT (NUDIX family)